MSSLAEKQDIIDKFRELQELEHNLNEQLILLKVIQHSTQDIPQFGRGEILPKEIKPSNQTLPLASTLKLCTTPQSVHQFHHNLPKRVAGIVQLQATELEYNSIVQLANQIGEMRQLIVASLVKLEPNSRYRAKLTRTLFPDILYQTLSRKIPLAPYNAETLLLSWCEEQKSIKKLSAEEAETIVENINSTSPPWQAYRNLLKLREVDAVYKATQVRVHPQAVIKYTDVNTGKVKYETRKVHSPVIVLSSSSEPIRHEKLGIYSEKDAEHNTLKSYKPLIHGTCLVYKAG